MPTSSEASRTGSGAGGGGGGGAGGGGMNPTTKAPAANGKIYHWWQKFCKSRLVLYFPFRVYSNLLRWWFVWMNHEYYKKNTFKMLSFTPWRIIQPERWSKKSRGSWWAKPIQQPFPAKSVWESSEDPKFSPSKLLKSDHSVASIHWRHMKSHTLLWQRWLENHPFPLETQIEMVNSTVSVKNSSLGTSCSEHQISRYSRIM